MEKQDYKKLEQYFQEEYPKSEVLEELFENENNEGNLRNNLNTKWNEIINNSTDKIDLKHILHKIHFNININSNKKQNSKIRQLYNWTSKIAVVLLLPFMALSMFFLIEKLSQPIQYTEIVTPKGEKAQFVLPDGSTGYLNSGSTLKYAFPFTENRLVELDGEGFFDVEHGENTFTVQVEKMKVQVHGTRFNVCSYGNDDEIVTTLEEGSVSVIRDVDGKGVTIKPGEQAVFLKSNNQLKYQKVNVDLYVSWKDNMLRFNDAPFADVVKKMERWYDVKIILEEELKYTQRYTMTIKTESFREMLELMKVTTPMKYEIKEDLVYITNLKKNNR